MKNSQIHANLPNANIRDFLSISIVILFEEECNNKKIIIPYIKDNPIEWAIKDCENDINFHQTRLKLLKKKQAIITLMNTHNWCEFDVSVETENDTGYKLHMNFIGTQEEYDILMLELKTM